MTSDVAGREVNLIGAVGADGTAGGADLPALDLRPPGDRYCRHPGDAVRLVIWGGAVALLAGFLGLATDTALGVTSDLERTVSWMPMSVREFSLALAQVAAVVVPVAVFVPLVGRHRWRRLGMIVLAVAVGGGFLELLDRALDVPAPVSGVVAVTWIGSASFPSLVYIAGAAAAAMIGTPWLSRSWRRAADLSLVVLALVMVVSGSAGHRGCSWPWPSAHRSAQPSWWCSALQTDARHRR